MDESIGVVIGLFAVVGLPLLLAAVVTWTGRDRHGS